MWCQLWVSFVVLLGTMTLVSSHGGALSLAVTKNEDVIRREECIRQVSHYLAQIEPELVVKSYLGHIRKYYRTYRFSDQLIFTYSAGCRELHKQIKQIKVSIPCYYDQTIMGLNEFQNVKDVIMASREAKYVIECEYACFHHKAFGARLIEDGLYETITGRKWTSELDSWESTADETARQLSYLSNLAEKRLHEQTDRRATSILFDYDAKPDDPNRLEEWKRRRALFLGSISPRELLVTISASTEYDPSHECPICHDVISSEPKAAKLSNCGHLFHEDCLMSWSKSLEEAERESLCPVCRETFQKDSE